MHDINTHVDKIFYINMDKDSERNEAIVREFDKHGIWNYERISGVSVDSVPERHGILGPFNESQDREKYIRGSIGCLYSHRKAIEIAIERGYKRICILEDDIFFIDDFINRFDSYINEINERGTYQIAYLGLADEDDVIDERKIKKLKDHCYGAFAYLINDEGWLFNFILTNIDYVFQEIDLLYNAMVTGNYLPDCYVSVPKLVLHKDPYDSNIQNR